MSDFAVGAARDLPLNETASWDAGAAKARVFDWAVPASLDPAKARRAFLAYDREIADQRARDCLTVWETKRDGWLFASIREVSQERDGFGGYASTFWAVDSYGTAMAPGAFKASLKTRGERRLVLLHHEPNRPIGKTTALKEDRTGLAFAADITTAATDGADAMALLRDDVPLGMSFGFYTVKDRTADSGDPLDFSQMPRLKPSEVRVITEVKLQELSLVSFPANEAAAITSIRALRSRRDERDGIALLHAIEHGDPDADQLALGQEIAAALAARPGPASARVDQQSSPKLPRRTHYDEYTRLMKAVGRPLE